MTRNIFLILLSTSRLHAKTTFNVTIVVRFTNKWYLWVGSSQWINNRVWPV